MHRCIASLIYFLTPISNFCIWWCTTPFVYDDVPLLSYMMMYCSFRIWWCTAPFVYDDVPLLSYMMMYCSIGIWWCIAPFVYDDVPFLSYTMMYCAFHIWWCTAPFVYDDVSRFFITGIPMSYLQYLFSTSVFAHSVVIISNCALNLDMVAAPPASYHHRI